MKQIAIKDVNMGVLVGGIMLDNGDVILADDGTYVKADEIKEDTYVIEEEFETWIDLTEEIIGN